MPRPTHLLPEANLFFNRFAQQSVVEDANRIAGNGRRPRE